MTDKDLINILKGIKRYCNRTHCDNCKFQTVTDDCQIREIVAELNFSMPYDWDIEEIERIINE